MKSPYTGKEMKRIYEQRVWNFRGEEFKYIRQSWLCEDSGEQFTDDGGDTAGYVQVTNQYRAKYGIPFTDEIIKISFQRAVFCQALSQEIPDFPLSYSEAYMLGMFSILDRLLDVPLEQALKSLPVSDELKDGLIKKEGMCGSLYRLTIAYEQGEWPRVTRIAQELNLTMETISRKYLEAVDYVTSTWNSLMEPFDGSVQTTEKEADN